jgi:hypothetical protein
MKIDDWRSLVPRLLIYFNKRLEPGYSKFGRWLYLGNCPKHLLEILFSCQECLRWNTPYKEKHDGKWLTYYRTFFYFKHAMPSLLTDYDWALKNNEISDIFKTCKLQSFYHEMVFAINADNRVFFHFTQITQSFSKGLDQWIDTA